MDDDQQRYLYCFGDQIRKYRSQQQKSLEQLAEDIDVDVKHMGEIERGRRDTTTYKFFHLYHALQLPYHFWDDVLDCLRKGEN